LTEANINGSFFVKNLNAQKPAGIQ